MSTDDLLTGPQVAALLGIADVTWRAYVSRGQAPPADDPDEGNPNPNRRSPRWQRSTIETWREARPRKGQSKGEVREA